MQPDADHQGDPGGHGGHQVVGPAWPLGRAAAREGAQQRQQDDRDGQVAEVGGRVLGPVAAQQRDPVEERLGDQQELGHDQPGPQRRDARHPGRGRRASSATSPQ